MDNRSNNEKVEKYFGSMLGIVFAALFTAVFCLNGCQRAQAKNVKSIRLNHTELIMNIGEKKTLKVKSVTPSEASKKVSWESSDKKVVKANKKGVLTAKGEGTAVVVAKAKKGGTTVKCTVKVTGKTSGGNQTASFPLASGKNGKAPVIRLNSGYDMPILGLGTYSLLDDVCVNSVSEALKLGGRDIIGTNQRKPSKIKGLQMI